MDNPQLVDYIRQHMGAGHTEATIRQHLINYGWPVDQVEAAFTHYNHSQVQSKQASASSSKVGATRRPRHRSKGKRWLALTVILIIIVAGGLIAHKMSSHKSTPVPTPTARLTHQQQQTIDVITIGGAVGQYVAANNNSALPTRTAPGPDNNSVVLCGTSCDPTTWQVSALSAYKPAGVKIVPYAPGLTAPDVNTLLLISGAKCSGNSLTTEKITTLSMVAMYATDTSAGLKQHCVSL